MISFHPFGGAQEVGASCGILKLGMRHIVLFLHIVGRFPVIVGGASCVVG